ncbi:MAG: metallopeptidase [Lachnospiraceae bacterium]|nr:metallopeptidase [Lachnospiraceae bacterium]
MPHIQSQTEWEEEMSIKILHFVQNEIYLDLRFMQQALSALVYRRMDGLSTFATDGVHLYFSSEPVLRIFKTNAMYLDRAYLHVVLHCIFKHLWMKGNREKNRWNLACDIAVEYTIDAMGKPCTKRILSWLRQNTYEQLKKEKNGVSAAVIYRYLTNKTEEELQALAIEFYTDDHRFWAEEEKQSPMMQQAKENWDKIARQTTLEKSRKGDESEDGEEIFAAQVRAGKSRRKYGDFLRKFSVLSEELHCDLEEFELGFYSYGLRLYGNLPLIEPIETKEVQKIREFVIVLDTSYSTSGELISGFLQETLRILTEKNSFFAKSQIRILQCDNQVRRDEVIRSEEDIYHIIGQLSGKYTDGKGSFEIVGGGSTDFRPAFAYVEELRKKGELKHLGGLLYFTDGKGIYPKKRTEYKTAFLFLEDYDEAAVPPWAMRLQLEPEEWIHEH